MIPKKIRGPILLVGFMGAGKSAVGARLAERLGTGFVDLDARIEEEAGASVAALFDREGEAGFRRRERAALERTLDECAGGGVIAGGGGLWTVPAHRDLCAARGVRTIWLDAPFADVARRVARDGSRPLFGDPEAAARLHAARLAAYRTADLRVDASGNDLEDVVERAMAALAEAADGRREGGAR